MTVYKTSQADPSKAILRDTDGEEGDGSLELVMPWLQTLHEKIRTCQFSAFWKEFNGSSEAAQGTSNCLDMRAGRF
jgi:hypothetical protein